MRVLITGASGLVGGALIEALSARGATVIGVTRTPDEQASNEAVSWIGWDDLDAGVAEADAVVHLAGEGIVDKRWSAARKEVLLASRVETGIQLERAIQRAERKPAVVVSASAVGYYGSDGRESLTEEASPGDGFLAELCRAWEEATADSGVRTVALRFGIVLSAEGGALQKMLLPFKLGLGGPIGRGRQWMSWIHIDDAVALIRHAIDNEALEGAVNATAPHPVSNRDFSKALGRALGRPALIPVPPVALKLRYGEGASVLTEGQHVVPQRATRSGFQFRYPRIDEALRDLVA